MPRIIASLGQAVNGVSNELLGSSAIKINKPQSSSATTSKTVQKAEYNVSLTTDSKNPIPVKTAEVKVNLGEPQATASGSNTDTSSKTSTTSGNIIKIPHKTFKSHTAVIRSLEELKRQIDANLTIQLSGESGPKLTGTLTSTDTVSRKDLYYMLTLRGTEFLEKLEPSCVLTEEAKKLFDKINFVEGVVNSSSGKLSKPKSINLNDFTLFGDDETRATVVQKLKQDKANIKDELANYIKLVCKHEEFLLNIGKLEKTDETLFSFLNKKNGILKNTCTSLSKISTSKDFDDVAVQSDNFLDACIDYVLSDGKLMHPQLLLLLAQVFGKELKLVQKSADKDQLELLKLNSDIDYSGTNKPGAIEILFPQDFFKPVKDLYQPNDNEKKFFYRQDVKGDGDCGYHAFDETLTRDQVVQELKNNKSSAEVKQALALPIKELLVLDSFFNYVKANKPNALNAESVSGIKDLDDNTKLVNLAKNNEILEAYIDFAIAKKGGVGDEVWPHPGVLEALAHIKNIPVRIWALKDSTLVPHKMDGKASYDYSNIAPAASKPENTIDILYVNYNHFDRLLPVEPEAVLDPKSFQLLEELNDVDRKKYEEHTVRSKQLFKKRFGDSYVDSIEYGRWAVVVIQFHFASEEKIREFEIKLENLGGLADLIQTEEESTETTNNNNESTTDGETEKPKQKTVKVTTAEAGFKYHLRRLLEGQNYSIRFCTGGMDYPASGIVNDIDAFDALVKLIDIEGQTASPVQLGFKTQPYFYAVPVDDADQLKIAEEMASISSQAGALYRYAEQALEVVNHYIAEVSLPVVEETNAIIDRPAQTPQSAQLKKAARKKAADEKVADEKAAPKKATEDEQIKTWLTNSEKLKEQRIELENLMNELKRDNPDLTGCKSRLRTCVDEIKNAFSALLKLERLFLPVYEASDLTIQNLKHKEWQDEFNLNLPGNVTHLRVKARTVNNDEFSRRKVKLKQHYNADGLAIKTSDLGTLSGYVRNRTMARFYREERKRRDKERTIAVIDSKESGDKGVTVSLTRAPARLYFKWKSTMPHENPRPCHPVTATPFTATIFARPKFERPKDLKPLPTAEELDRVVSNN